MVPPFTAYGIGLRPGDQVVAYFEGNPISDAFVDESGNWLMYIDSNDANIIDGDIITFKVNGEPRGGRVAFMGGGAPDDLQNGIDLRSSGAPRNPTAEGGFSIPPFPGGLTLTVFTGSLEAFDAAGWAYGLITAAATAEGRYVVYVFGAPLFVNANFTRIFSGGFDGHPLVVRSRS